MKPIALLGFLLFAIGATASALEATNMHVLYDFASPQTMGRWRNVNDGVMGGVSRGELLTLRRPVQVGSGRAPARQDGLDDSSCQPSRASLRGATVLSVRLGSPLPPAWASSVPPASTPAHRSGSPGLSRLPLA